MSSFASNFAADAFPALLAEHGESVTYLPAAGGTRAISAIIRRGELIGAYSAQGFPPQREAMVLDSATDGISASELNPSGDRLTVTEESGSITYRIRKPRKRIGGVLVIPLE